MSRPFWSYRGWRRNAVAGRALRGNTKPQDRILVRAARLEEKQADVARRSR